MFSLIRDIQNIFRMTKLSRLVDLAKQTDEVLIGSNLNPETRQVLQKKRDELETQIRALQAA